MQVNIFYLTRLLNEIVIPEVEMTSVKTSDDTVPTLNACLEMSDMIGFESNLRNTFIGSKTFGGGVSQVCAVEHCTKLVYKENT